MRLLLSHQAACGCDPDVRCSRNRSLNRSLARVWRRSDRIAALAKQLDRPAAIGIRPTGWSYRASGLQRSVGAGGKVSVYGVPYSEHSSWHDLCACVKALRPGKLIPTVNARDERQAQRIIDLFTPFLSGETFAGTWQAIACALCTAMRFMNSLLASEPATILRAVGACREGGRSPQTRLLLHARSPAECATGPGPGYASCVGKRGAGQDECRRQREAICRGLWSGRWAT